MTDRAMRAFRVWMSLTQQEREELNRAIRDLDGAGQPRKSVIEEDIKKGTRVALGPIAGGCPYCGR